MNELITVLMCVHNEPINYIDTAVKSIDNQTYKKLEFIIIDDASNEETSSYLTTLSEKYPFIKLYRNQNNIGLTASLNKGLGLSNGEFIARMDADDYSCPTRIEKQYNYLKSHPEIDIIGTGVVSFGQTTIFMSPINGATYKDVQSDLFFMSTLCHPSVMIRHNFLLQNNLSYDEAVKKGQDYDLWERSSIYGRLAVLPEVLLYYRTHSKQITSTSKTEQNTTLEKVITRRLQRFGITPTEKEKRCHMALLGQRNSATIEEIKHWINKLISHTKDSHNVDTDNFTKNLNRRYVLAKLKKRKVPSLREGAFVINLVKTRIKISYRLKKLKKAIKSEI